MDHHGYRIDHTGDSGIVVQGRFASISGNVITNTGTDSSIPYARHGIYSKSQHARIVGNRIVGFSAQGISTRSAGAFIAGNLVQRGSAGVGYWRDGPVAGTTVICGNVIAEVRYGVLIGDSGAPDAFGERFRITRNRIRAPLERGIYVPSGHVQLDREGNLIGVDRVAQKRVRPIGRRRGCGRPFRVSSRTDSAPWVGLGAGAGIIILIAFGIARARLLRSHRGDRFTQAA